MSYLELIQAVGNKFIVGLFLTNKISKLTLADAIGNSNADMVEEYKNQNNKDD